MQYAVASGAYWHLDPKRLKLYPHFDAPISVSEAEALANDRKRVASHSFYPFLQFRRKWTRWAEKGKRGKPKSRTISYACRADSYIFAKYREELEIPYEDLLSLNGLASSIIAYRNIAKPGTGRGKCNIDFARDAFEAVKSYGECHALAMDISDFFGSIDHAALKSIWCRMLSVKRLPPDHFAVFDAVTRFASVDAQAAYERLGYFGPKYKMPDGTIRKGYLKTLKKMPKQLCRGYEFREKIAGGKSHTSIIHRNGNPHGIPQGSTISDILANMYLLDFDVRVSQLVADLGGTYYRYSDDLLIVAPCSESAICALEKDIGVIISAYGPALVIKPEKTTLHQFTASGAALACKRIGGTSAANGLEYIGFRFDGQTVYIRDSTIANCKRKIVKAVYFTARSHVRNFAHYKPADMYHALDTHAFIERFGQVEDFYEHADDHSHWTFWTYAKRSSRIFGSDGVKILRQLRGYRRFCRTVLLKAVAEELANPTPRLPLIPKPAPTGASSGASAPRASVGMPTAASGS